jgi:2-succinyl-6-hydroxy-2,4-cyclohexadiene-1-carboxylate synthase
MGKDGVVARDPGEGPRATLLHGFAGSSDAWGDAVSACLRGAGVEAAYADLPGHGRRTGEVEPARFSLPATLAGVRAVHGRSPRALVGYSMGGRLALHFARRHPDLVDRLVLESASPGLEVESERVARRVADEKLATLLEREGIEAFVEQWEALPLFASQRTLPEDVRDEMRRGRLANDPRSLAASLRGVGTGVLPSLWADLDGIAMPILILVGALDVKFVEIGRRMADHLPRATLCVVEGAGHAVHRERPAEWCAAVSDFLTGP